VGGTFLFLLLTWGTTNFTAVKVPHEARKFGNSGYTASKLIKHAFNMITGFSTAPLQVASAIGFSFAIFGFSILTYLLARWAIFGSVVPGFVFIASMIALFSGSQLLALGVMGEYIARMHLKSMGRPAYLVAPQDAFESGSE
jgi:undecaprenyl-phosphate 4-deoxy-4-formamido-L-arabinose transferase